MPEDNKTEQATPRRRKKAREQGQVARSRDLMAGLATFTAVLVLATQAPGFAGEWRTLLRRSLESLSTAELSSQIGLLVWSSLTIFRGPMIAVGLGWMAAMAGALAQGGLVFAPAALQPNPARLSPVGKLQQLFSVRALGTLAKSLLPVGVVIYLTAAVLMRDWSSVLVLPYRSLASLAKFGQEHIFEIAWKSALVLLLWSGFDYLLEHHKLESDLRMSRQDLADEFKETEGNPAVKARIRRLQRQLRRRRMLEDVKRASVVITNPTEFAVALAYGPEMGAPTVVAKGRNLVAQQIKQMARWQGIALVENPPLAHALYRAVEVGQSIPPKLYIVVAGILAAIYRAQQRAQTGPSLGGVR